MGIIGSLLCSDETLEGKGRRWQARLVAARRVTRLLCLISTDKGNTQAAPHTRRLQHGTKTGQLNPTTLRAMYVCATCRGVER